MFYHVHDTLLCTQCLLVDNVLMSTLVTIGKGGHGLLGLVIGVSVLHTAGDGNMDLSLLTSAR